MSKKTTSSEFEHEKKEFTYIFDCHDNDSNPSTITVQASTEEEAWEELLFQRNQADPQLHYSGSFKKVSNG